MPYSRYLKNCRTTAYKSKPPLLIDWTAVCTNRGNLRLHQTVVRRSVLCGLSTIMAKLGVLASTVINMLYKQIVMTRSIPFPLSLPQAPMAPDEMDTSAFDAMMAGQGLPLGEVLQRMRSTEAT